MTEDELRDVAWSHAPVEVQVGGEWHACSFDTFVKQDMLVIGAIFVRMMPAVSHGEYILPKLFVACDQFAAALRLKEL